MNHFPGMWSIHRKHNLAKNLSLMRREFPVEYNFFPITWVLPQERSSIIDYFRELPNHYNENSEEGQEDDEEAKVLIAKPYSSAAGKGISLLTSTEDIPQEGNWVVQEYLNQ